MAGNRFKLALVQLLVSSDKTANVQKAIAKIKEAADAGAKVVVLPECFNSPYGNQYFAEYAESVPGETTNSMQEIARQKQIYVVAGTIPEREGDKLYNCLTAFSPTGYVGKFRKMHLFDIDIPGKITFKESDTLTSGAQPQAIHTDFCKMGLGICYDMRFSELARVYGLSGCDLLIYPGAFNMTTGPAHWELLARATALQNQCYMAVCSPARDASASYVAWGHSMIVDPWGTVVATADEKEAIIYADIDMEKVGEVRKSIPLYQQRRTDVYDTVAKCPINSV